MLQKQNKNLKKGSLCKNGLQRVFLFFVFAFVSIATFASAQPVQAAAKQSTLSLTMETNKLTIALTPELNGKFGQSQNANISVTTDNFTGYRLTITSNGGTALVDGNGHSVESINTAISETTFRNNASYVNKWGYKPSQYVNGNNEVVTSNTNYLPAPSTSGSLIDATSAANSTAKTYTLSIAAKINYGIPPGTYTRNITVAAIANDIVYSITYNKNATGTVANMPVTNPQIVTIAGGTAAASSKTTLSSATPTRTGYDFMGWCSTTTTADAAGSQSCSGTTYAAGADYGIDQTADGTNITLYAIWQTHTYTVNLNGNGATTAGSSTTSVSYNATTLGSFTAPQRQYNVSGFTMGNNADGATVTFASTGNCTAANNCKSTYTFNGWYQESAAENKIAGTNGALESSTDYTNGSGKWVRSEEPTTLYAGWTSQSVTLPTINKSGYVCKWNTNSNGTGTSYNSGASITPAQATTLYGVCTAIDYTITINYGNGISSLAGAGWDDYGNSIKKIYHIGDTIDLTTITPTYNTGYNGAKYVKMDQNGTLSGSTYTVGAGDGAIKFSASGLDTPVCTMQGGYTKVYNYQDTIITATPNDSRYDSSVNITYSFGYSTGNSSNTLGNFDTATTDNTRTITKTDFLAARYYGVTVTVTDSSDSTITNTCTSGTGHQQGTSAAAARTLMALVNSRVDLNGNGGTLSGGTNPFYVQYGSSAKYTGRYNTTAVSALPTVTPPTGYDLAGWYTATTGGSKVLNANGSLTGSAVTNWSNANGQWVKTGSSNSENVAANQLYAHYTPKTYTITLNQNGATTNGSTSTTVSYDAYNLGSITLPQRQYTVSNFTTTNNNASGATVTFSDGTNCESASNCKSTYAFDGWYKEAAATNKIASEDTTPSLEANTDYTNADGQWNSTSNQTLYAGWTGESVTLPTITKTGYTCGWTTTSTGATTITYESGASIIPSSDYILYGVCTAKKYNINLEGNGATNNYTTSTKVTFNATALDAIATLPTKDSTTDTRTLTSFSTSGNNASGATVTYQSSGNCTAANNCKSTNTTTYTFKGWYKESAATTKVASNAAIPALQANVSGYTDSGAKWTKASTTTLYAGWTDNVGDYPTVTLPTITKTGYVCGWKDHNNNTYTSGETITPSDSLTMSGTCTIKSNLTLKVSFNSTYVTSVKVCTVAGDCTGDNLKGTVTTSGNTVGNLTYNTAYYLYPTYKTGAVLNSWAKDSGAVGSLSSTSAANPTYTIGDGTNAVTLNAKYDTYTITLNRNCSTTATGSTSTTVTYNATTLGAITVPTCANATGTRNINGFTLPSGNHADGATVTYPSTGCTSASNCKSTNTTTYTFKGWYKESAATNKIASTAATPALQPSTSYTNADSKWTSTSAQTLYAGWTASAGNYSSVTLPAIEKTGYTCGWTTTSTGATTITYASGSSLTPSSATTTLYGVCTADTYTITLNKNGATNSPTTSTTATYDSTTLGAIATLPTRVYTLSSFALDTSATGATVTYQSSGNCTAANNCKSTYTFKGWYKESAATNKIASNAATPALQANTSYTDANSKWTSTSDQTLYAGWTSKSVTLPNITRTGYTCVWKDQSNNTYNPGDTITPSSNRTMTGYCTGNTYTATFYYQSNPTLRGQTISSITAQCTVSNSAGNCSPTIPEEVTGSVGTYNNSYVGVASAVNTMSSNTTVTLTGDATFYAVYREPVTLYKPGATTSAAATTVNLYRNQYFTSASALSTTVLSNSTTGTSNYGYTVGYTQDSGYALYGFATDTSTNRYSRATNCGTNGTTNCNNIANLALSDITNAYAYEYKSFTATYYYNNNTTTDTCTTAAVTSITKSANRYAYVNTSSQTAISNRNISIPTEVTGSKGTCGEAYLNVGTATNSMEGVTPNTSQGNQTYYVRYSAPITNYYYNTSAYTSRTIYRNQRVNGTSASSMSDAVLATANTGTSNYATATGPGNSVWNGLSTTASNGNAPTYASVAAAATANVVYDKLYTGYAFNVTFDKGTNTDSIGANSGSCRVSATGATAGGTSCTVATPTISPKAGYTACGWSTTKDATSGTAAGNNITLNTNATTYYGNSKPATYAITLDGNGANNSYTTSTTVTYLDTALGALATRPTKANTTGTRNINGFTLPASNNADGATVTYPSTGCTSASNCKSTNTTTYAFNGWHETSGTGAKVASNAATPALQASVSGYTNSSSQWTKTSGTTLYAGWDATAGAYSSVTLPSISKTGYYCGWTTTATNATTITYTSGGSLTPSSATTTLYGVCTIKTDLSLQITFDSTYVNSVAVKTGSASGTTVGTVSTSGNSVENLTYNTAYYLVPSYKTGAVLDSWSKDSGAVGTLSSTSAANPTYTIGDGTNAVTLNAKYATYNITLDRNCSTTAAGSTSTTVTYNATTLAAITVPTCSNGTATRTVSGWTTPVANNADGATVNGGTAPGTLNNTASITYTFNGWHDTSGTGTLVASKAATPALQASVSGYTDSGKHWTKTSGATLYAGWNSSTGNYSSITLPSITKTGYYCGWTTIASGATTSSDPFYEPGSSFTPTTTPTTLYGVCSKKKDLELKVSFNSTYVSSVKVCKTSGNCSGTNLVGTVSTSGESVGGLIFGDAYYLYPVFTTGSIFQSWAQDSGTVGTLSSTSASNPTYTIGDGLNAATITAKYNTYNITLDRNCSTTATGSTSTTVTYKATKLGTITVPTCSNATGTRTLSGFTLDSSATNATVTFPSSGNCTSASSCTSTNTTTYAFKGWYTTSGATTQVASTAATPALQASVTNYTNGSSQWTRTSATTLYAGWTATAGAYSSITLPNITKTGYRCYWTDGNTTYNPSSSIVPTDDLTISGYCDIKQDLTLKVSFNSTYVSSIAVKTGSASGTTIATIINSGDVATVTFGEKYYLVPTYTTGSKLSSWAKDSGAVGSLSSTTGANPYYTIGDGVNAVTHNGARKTYTVTLNQCDATTEGSTSTTATYYSTSLAAITVPQRKYNVSFTVNSGATASSTDPLTSTYTFGGWVHTSCTGATVVANTAATPALQASVSGYTDSSKRWTKDGAATLYAKWTGQSVTLPTLTLPGHECVWSDGTTTYTPGDAIVPASDLPLTDVCTPNVYTITLNKNGADNSPTSSTTVTYGATKLGALATRPSKNNVTGTRKVQGFTTPSGNHADGATVTFPSTGCTSASSCNSTNTTTYTFNGWHLSSGTGTKLASNAATPALIASVSGYTNGSKQWTRTSGATLYAGWDESVGAYSSITLPNITKTGYTCGWTTSSTGATTITYEPGDAFTPASTPVTLYGVCVGNTYTATFYYQSDSTLRGETIATAEATCTVSNSAGNCSPTIPTEVTGSVGTYNNAYVGVASAANTMSSATSVTLTGDATFYAVYRSAVTLHKPGATTDAAATTVNLYRNQYFSSDSALATTVLSSSTTGKTNYTYTAAYTEDSGYALYGFATAIDSTTRPSTCAANGTTACSTITRLATSDISDAYAIEYKAFTATIYYNNNTTTDSCTTANVTTATKALNRYAYINASSQTAIKNSSVGVTSTSIPEAVRNSKGTCGEAYLNVGTSTNNMTANSLSSANGDQTYYTRYSASITNYYYNTSAYASRTLYRNQRVNGASSVSTAVLATASTGTANYCTDKDNCPTGPGSSGKSVWTGLSTSQPAASNSNAPTYTTVAGAATANAVYNKLYTTYTFNVTFAKGTNTSSIGAESGSCRVSATGATSGGVNCNIEAPTISPKSGYTANGWSTTKDDTNSGTAAGSNISVNSNGVTYYGNSKANPYTITITAGNGISALTASGWTGTGTATISKTFYTGDVVDLSTITPTRKTGYTGTAYTKTDTYGTLSGSNYTVGAGAGSITLSASALATPTCAISSSATTTVYNYQDTTITATDVSSNYDSGVTITYTFGYAATTSAALGNFEAGTNNTFTVAKDAYRGTRYYGTTISVTDGTLSKSCTSSTGTGTNGRKEVTYINSRIDFDANGGTLSGTSPLYVSYNLGGSFTRSSGSSAWSGGVTYDCNTVGSSTSCQYHYPGAYAYTTATDTTISELPSATSSQTGYQFDGWYTAATGGSRVTGQTTGSWYGSGQTTYASYTGQFIYAPNTGCSGSGCTSTVTGWKYGSTNVRNSSSYTQSRYWRKTGTNLNDNVAANKLYAHYVPKTYTITLNSNNATNTPTDSTVATYDSTTLSAIATLPTRSYTFDGFTLDSSASGATTTFASTGDCTSASNCTYNYTFNGWHKNSGTGALVASNAATPALQASVSGYTDANSKWTRDDTATLYAGWTSASVTLPNLTKTGYTCEWRDQDNNTYTPGSAINQPTANRTLTGYCTGNTYTATFYYQSDPDLRDEAISTATAQCTVSNSAGNCTATIPSVVRSSVGTYNNAYAGVAATVNTMAAANSGTSVTLSGNANFYAIYRTNVTIHKPVSSTSTTDQALYRNSYFTSNSALTTKLSSSTTGTSHYSYTSSFTDDSGGYTFNRFSSDINSLSTISSTCGADGASSCNSIAGLATSNITEVYSVDKKTITATIYYNNNTTTNACTTAAVTSVASSANRYAYITAASVSSISDRNINIPDEVKNSKGTCGQAYLNVGTATNNMTAVTPHTSRGNINYYTRYFSEITLYYYNSNAYTNRKLYRNQRVSGTSASSMSTAVLATANTGTSNNFTPPSGPGGAAFGVVRAGGAPCMTCEGTMGWSAAPTSNGVYSTLYAGYSMDVFYAKGANTSSIGGSGGETCMVTATGATTGSTSCTVTTPSITPKTGYTACGWSTTNGATSGTNANSSLTLSTSGQTYYGNSIDVTLPDYGPDWVTGPFAIEINNNSYYAQFKATVKANDSSGSNIRYTIDNTNAQSGASNTCANNTNCVIAVVTSYSWQNSASTKRVHSFRAYDAAGNYTSSLAWLPPFGTGSGGGASIQQLYIYQLYGGIRANSSNYSWFNAVYSASSTEISNKISQASSTRMATMIKDMFGSSEATTFFSGKSVDFKVDHLYHAILGRSPDSSGVSTWTTMLNQGKSMRYVAAQMTKSAEAQQLFGKLGFITGNPEGDID